MYQERMLNYYPPTIRKIKEFQSIVDAEFPEIEDLASANEQLLADAYLTTMGESKIQQWEKRLGITPSVDSTIDNRRDTVLARIRGKGKLNTNLINTIVETFTGGTARSWVENSTLYVVIKPPAVDKSYNFPDVENELKQKLPAHLNIVITRSYQTWKDIADKHETWADVENAYDTWNDVYIG